MGLRPMNRRSFIRTGAAVTTVGFVGCTGGDDNEVDDDPVDSEDDHGVDGNDGDDPTDPEVDQEVDDSLIVVDSKGSDFNSGTQQEPLKTITAAVGLANPGDTVYVNPGEYTEPIRPPRGGEPGRPITITGPVDAVLKTDTSRWWWPVEIRYSHIHLTGLTIDGLENPDAPEEPDSYAEGQLVAVFPPYESMEYLEDIVVSPHAIGNTQAAMVRMMRTKNSEVSSFRVIGPAGTMWRFSDETGVHGEIVYLGSPQGGLDSDLYPWDDDYDETRNIHVHHIDNSAGYEHSQLVDAKRGTRNILVEYCTDGGGSDQHSRRGDPAASVEFKGLNCVVRWCRLLDGNGYGMRLYETWEPVVREGRSPLEKGGHAVYGNEIIGFSEGPLNFRQRLYPEHPDLICGNIHDGKPMELETKDGGTAELDPGRSCSEDISTGDGIGHLGGENPWS